MIPRRVMLARMKAHRRKVVPFFNRKYLTVPIVVNPDGVPKDEYIGQLARKMQKNLRKSLKTWRDELDANLFGMASKWVAQERCGNAGLS